MVGARRVQGGWAALLVARACHAGVLCVAVAATAHAQTPAALPTALSTPSPSTSAGDAPGPVGGPAAQLPGAINLPTMDQLHLPVPRPVRAATAAMGMGRQRLALVVGIGTVGNQRVVDSAARDSQAVAAALRSAGFVVMLREDINAADLRSSLAEFRDRLQPGGVGFIYATGLGAQVQGQNVLLPREAVLDAAAPPAALAAQVHASGVPVAELVNALIGPADSPRLLVLDAAYKHPALAHLPAAGLVEQRLPPGLMALFGHDLGAVKEVPAVAPLPIPAPTDPREMAASAFAGALVKALTTTRINGPEALRTTRRELVNGSMGQTNPWLSGDTEAREELAEATLLDAVPHTPEELAREGLRQMTRLATRPAAQAGEQSVASVLQQSASTAAPAPAPAGTGSATLARNAIAGEPGIGSTAIAEPAAATPTAPTAPTAPAAPGASQAPAPASAAPAATPSAPATPAAPTAPTAPATPSTPSAPSAPVQAAGAESIGTQTAASVSNGATVANSASLASGANGAAASGASSVSGALGTAASVAGTALSAAGTAVGIAGSVAATAVAVRAAEASAAVSVAGTAVSTVGSLAGSAVTMAARALGSSGGSEQPARQLATPGALAQAAAVPVPANAGTALAAGTGTARPAVAAAATATAATSTTASDVASGLSGGAMQAANQALQRSAPDTRPANAAGGVDASSAAGTSNLALPNARARSASNTGAAVPAAPAVPVADMAAARSAVGGDLPVAAINAPSAAAATTIATAARTGLPTQRLPDARTARSASGGERPAYVPRSNPFGHAEGDTFTYRVTDTWKGQVNSEYTMALEEVRHDGQLLANGQQIVMDPQGRLIRNTAADGSSSEFEPFQDLWWANPARGQHHDVQFTEFFQRADRVRGQTEWTGSTSVGRLRKMDTPAGSFDVLPLESSGWWTQTLASGARETGTWSRTVWYAPKLGQPVQIDIEDADRLGKLLKRERVELLHAQSARSTLP